MGAASHQQLESFNLTNLAFCHASPLRFKALNQFNIPSFHKTAASNLACADAKVEYGENTDQSRGKVVYSCEGDRHFSTMSSELAEKVRYCRFFFEVGLG